MARINGELVVSTPKTQNSIRIMAIPQHAVDLLVAEHEKHPDTPYMFPSPKTGTMFDPDSFRLTHATTQMKQAAADMIGEVINRGM